MGQENGLCCTVRQYSFDGWWHLSDSDDFRFVSLVTVFHCWSLHMGVSYECHQACSTHVSMPQLMIMRSNIYLEIEIIYILDIFPFLEQVFLRGVASMQRQVKRCRKATLITTPLP